MYPSYPRILGSKPLVNKRDVPTLKQLVDTALHVLLLALGRNPCAFLNLARTGCNLKQRTETLLCAKQDVQSSAPCILLATCCFAIAFPILC